MENAPRICKNDIENFLLNEAWFGKFVQPESFPLK